MKKSEIMLKCLAENGIDTFNTEYLVEANQEYINTWEVFPMLIKWINAKIKGKKDAKFIELAKEKKNKEDKEKYEKQSKEWIAENMPNDMTDKQYVEKYVFPDIKKLVQQMKSNKDIMAKINADIESLKKEYDPEDHKHFVVFRGLVYNNQGDYIEIIDGSQAVAIKLHWVVENIAEALETKYYEAINYGVFTVGTGDGDEGSVYIDNYF